MKSKAFFGRITAALLFACSITGLVRADGSLTNIVTSTNETSLQSAMAMGGWVGIGFNGTLTFTNTIVITNNVILDGSQVTATLSGGNVVRLFYVTNGASLTISNLTLADGCGPTATNASVVSADAGVLYNAGGMVALIGCTVINNTARMVNGLARGGAIFNDSGTVCLYRSEISSNSLVCQSGGGQCFGGAVYNVNGLMSITECQFNGNTSQYLSGTSGLGMGGAIYQASGVIAITNCSFKENQVSQAPSFGGAIAAMDGYLNLNRTLFYGNQAISQNGAGYDAYGGAVYSSNTWTATDCGFLGNTGLGSVALFGSAPSYGGAIYNEGTLALNRCWLVWNSIGFAFDGDAFGGGIYNKANLTATNCALVMNSAGGRQAFGGGIYNEGSAVLMNSTIASNNCFVNYSWGDALGAGTQIADVIGDVHLHNSILANNSANNNVYGLVIDDGYNLCSDDSAGLNGTSKNSIDPQLTALVSYDGQNLCLGLQLGSPAINSGDPADFPSTDQRGYARPVGSGPDIGAFEYGAAPYGVPVLNLAPSGANWLLSFTAYATNTYRLQYSTNLVNWTDILTNGPITTQTNLSQPIGKPNSDHGYFRVVTP